MPIINTRNRLPFAVSLACLALACSSAAVGLIRFGTQVDPHGWLGMTPFMLLSALLSAGMGIGFVIGAYHSVPLRVTKSAYLPLVPLLVLLCAGSLIAATLHLLMALDSWLTLYALAVLAGYLSLRIVEIPVPDPHA